MLRPTVRLLNEHLKILGLSGQTATLDEIKKAFREQTKRHHPDVGGDAEHFKKICDAYNALNCEGKAQSGEGDIYSSSASHPHWEYFYGSRGNASSQNRREGAGDEAKHGKHGAEWANDCGGDANFSTRDFYRPYTAYYNGKTGFTEEEIQDAQRRTLLHKAWYIYKRMFLLLALYICYTSYEVRRIEAAAQARRDGYTDTYWEGVEKDEALGKSTPVLSSYWERKKEEWEKGRIEDEKRRKALGLRNPFEPSAASVGPQAVSFKGQPFTPEGLAELRRIRKGLPKPPIDLTGIDDVSYESDTIDS